MRSAARSSPPRSPPPGRASGVLLGIWLVTVVVLLELAGFHTPTDLVGGLLLATAAVAGAVVLARSGLRRGALWRPRPGG